MGETRVLTFCSRVFLLLQWSLCMVEMVQPAEGDLDLDLDCIR